jgi:hypothetical protein
VTAMDERTAEIYRRAYDTLDRLANFEPSQRDPLAEDALEHWDRLRQQSIPTQQHGSSELVYKTFESPQPVQQQSATMDPETQARWDTWADNRIRSYVDCVVDVIGDETGKDYRALQAKIDVLTSAVNELKARLDGKVTPMRGARDDAA